jgi:MFS family permease
MADIHDPYAALRYRDYRHLLAGSVLSSIGSEMQGMAVGWELYQRTNSATVLGCVGLVLFLPVFLLALPAGHAADRYSRKGLLLAGQGLMALAGLGLAVLSFLQGPVPPTLPEDCRMAFQALSSSTVGLGASPLGTGPMSIATALGSHITPELSFAQSLEVLFQGPVLLTFLCLLVAGVSRAFSAPARWSLVPQVVPAGVLPNAITWNSSGWQTASMAGPALGGLVIALTGQAWGAYLLAALCVLTCAGLVVGIQPRAGSRPREALTLHTLLAGIRFIWRTKLILATITLDLFAVLLGGATALLPMFARDILEVGPVGLGWLRAAPSMGALVMALALVHRPPLRHAGRSLLWAVAGFGAATVGFGLSRDFVLSFTMLALTGALDNISVVVRGTLVQVLTPDAMRGRVSAVNSVFISSSNELGAFESGVTAQLFGPVLSVVGGGIGTILVVAAVMVVWPEVLRLGPLHKTLETGPPQREDPLALGEPSAPRS